MTPLLGIIKKELKVAFTTPIAYVVFFFFTLLTSLLFYNQLLEYEKKLQRARHFEDTELLALLNFNDVILAPVFLSVQVILAVLVPILTMRMLAEEKRHRTMELLLTTPIRPIDVVLGKYLAYLLIVVCLCALVLIYPAILTVFGSNSLVEASVVDWPTTLLGTLGIFLTGIMFGAVGFCFSSLTESQVLAAVLGIMVLLLMWLLARFGQETAGWVGETMAYISPVSHMGNFVSGVLHLGDVFYYLSVAGFFLFFTHRMVEGQRWR